MGNVLREKILDRNYIDLINIIEMSERNREIVKKFVSGATYSAIAKEYNITAGRIRTIIVEYSRKCCNSNKMDMEKAKESAIRKMYEWYCRTDGYIPYDLFLQEYAPK